MKPQSTSSYDVDNRYRFYKSLDSKNDISPDRRGVRPARDDNSSKNFLNGFIIWYQRPLNDTEGVTSLFNNPNYLGSWLSAIIPFCIVLISFSILDICFSSSSFDKLIITPYNKKVTTIKMVT